MHRLAHESLSIGCLPIKHFSADGMGGCFNFWTSASLDQKLNPIEALNQVYTIVTGSRALLTGAFRGESQHTVVRAAAKPRTVRTTQAVDASLREPICSRLACSQNLTL